MNASPACPECGATNQAEAARCWLCHRPLAESDVVTAEAVAPLERPRGGNLVLLSMNLALVGLCLAVGLGLALTAPGVLIAYAIAVALVFVPLAVLGLRGSPAWQAAPGARWKALAASAGVTAALIVALMISAGVALFGLCVSAMSNARFH